MRRAFANRVDGTSKALIAYAKSLGYRYHPQDATIDGLLWLPDGRLVEVDWKSPGGLMTPAQQRLVLDGWPIRFISSVEQLDALGKETR